MALFEALSGDRPATVDLMMKDRAVAVLLGMCAALNEKSVVSRRNTTAAQILYELMRGIPALKCRSGNALGAAYGTCFLSSFAF